MGELTVFLYVVGVVTALLLSFSIAFAIKSYIIPYFNFLITLKKLDRALKELKKDSEDEEVQKYIAETLKLSELLRKEVKIGDVTYK